MVPSLYCLGGISVPRDQLHFFPRVVSLLQQLLNYSTVDGDQLALEISRKQLLALVHTVCHFLLGYHAVLSYQRLDKFKSHLLDLFGCCIFFGVFVLDFIESHGK